MYSFYQFNRCKLTHGRRCYGSKGTRRRKYRYRHFALKMQLMFFIGFYVLHTCQKRVCNESVSTDHFHGKRGVNPPVALRASAKWSIWRTFLFWGKRPKNCFFFRLLSHCFMIDPGWDLFFFFFFVIEWTTTSKKKALFNTKKKKRVFFLQTHLVSI